MDFVYDHSLSVVVGGNAEREVTRVKIGLCSCLFYATSHWYSSPFINGGTDFNGAVFKKLI